MLSGSNVIDTASNYRGGRSELCIGQALQAVLCPTTAEAALPPAGEEEETPSVPLTGLGSAAAPPPGQAGPPEAQFEPPSDALTRQMLFVSSKCGYTTGNADLLRHLVESGTLYHSAMSRPS